MYLARSVSIARASWVAVLPLAGRSSTKGVVIFPSGTHWNRHREFGVTPYNDIYLIARPDQIARLSRLSEFGRHRCISFSAAGPDPVQG
jgi:hypothetical protein